MNKIITENKLKIMSRETFIETRLTWQGETEGHASEAVRTFLYNAKDQALSKNAKIVLDFTQLQFMNSAYIGTITNLVNSINTNNGKVHLIFDTGTTWQNLCVRALKIIFASQENVTITDLD